MIEELKFPAGCHLLAGWQANQTEATERLKEIFDGTIAGQYDEVFAWAAPQNAIHTSASLNLMTLTMMNQFYGLRSAEFYKGDPERYVRTTLMSRRLLGLNKLYVSWPVYAFTAEALGQEMMYPDKFPPGTDPEIVLVDRHNWQDIATPDLDDGIPRLIEEMIDCYQRLTGSPPGLHLSAPYSLAADIYGQEQLIMALTHEPEFVNQFLDYLVDHILKPWIDHFLVRFPDAWIELSDASGSPFFIGPENCKNMAIRSIRRLVDENSWGNRVYDANYRGDYVAKSNQATKSTRRRRSANNSPPKISLLELFEQKHAVCSDFVIRLDDDQIPVSFYMGQAIERNVPLFLGIGASQIDRNSIADLEMTKQNIRQTSNEYVEAIKTVANAIQKNGYEGKVPPWPGVIYFEDISAESSFELIEIIVGTALTQGAF